MQNLDEKLVSETNLFFISMCMCICKSHLDLVFTDQIIFEFICAPKILRLVTCTVPVSSFLLITFNGLMYNIMMF